MADKRATILPPNPPIEQGGTQQGVPYPDNANWPSDEELESLGTTRRQFEEAQSQLMDTGTAQPQFSLWQKLLMAMGLGRREYERRHGPGTYLPANNPTMPTTTSTGVPIVNGRPVVGPGSPPGSVYEFIGGEPATSTVLGRAATPLNTTTLNEPTVPTPTSDMGTPSQAYFDFNYNKEHGLGNTGGRWVAPGDKDYDQDKSEDYNKRYGFPGAGKVNDPLQGFYRNTANQTIDRFENPSAKEIEAGRVVDYRDYTFTPDGKGGFVATTRTGKQLTGQVAIKASEAYSAYIDAISTLSNSNNVIYQQGIETAPNEQVKAYYQQLLDLNNQAFTATMSHSENAANLQSQMGELRNKINDNLTANNLIGAGSAERQLESVEKQLLELGHGRNAIARLRTLLSHPSLLHMAQATNLVNQLSRETGLDVPKLASGQLQITLSDLAQMNPVEREDALALIEETTGMSRTQIYQQLASTSPGSASGRPVHYSTLEKKPEKA